ncbi:MAG: hypothetical protein KJP00_08030 [Bacteroidia bacterium]|nr:hypothetical protein [Bacteroidia bacterium]
MSSKFSYWRYIYKLKYFRDSRHELYWIKAVVNFVNEVLSLENEKLRLSLIKEIERQLQFQSRYYLNTSYFRQKENLEASFRKKLIYQILYLSKSQRIDLMRNIISALPYKSEYLKKSKQYVEAYTLAKNFSRRIINKYYVLINKAINEGRYTLAVRLSARCLRTQYSSLSSIDYSRYNLQGYKTPEYLVRLRIYFDMRGSSWINRYYRLISKSSREVFQYEDSILNKYQIADKSMARFAMINIRKINELIYKLKYCK